MKSLNSNIKSFQNWVLCESGDPGSSEELYNKALEMQLHRLAHWVETNSFDETPWHNEIKAKIQELIDIFHKNTGESKNQEGI